MNTPDLPILAFDVGSTTIGMAVVARDGEILAADYRFHHGSVESTLIGMVANLNARTVLMVAGTGGAGSYLNIAGEFDALLCAIRASEQHCPDRRELFVIGAERFHLVRFDSRGEYSETRSNTACAAGTGSFIDQQARRLNLADAAHLSDTAWRNDGAVPKIASRCAVFARTDLIHAQQEGYRIEEICDGLCAGVARNVAETVLGNNQPAQPAYCIGGVALNRSVVRHLSTICETHVAVPQSAHLFGAIGAALLAWDQVARSVAAKRPATPTEPINVSVEALIRRHTGHRTYRYQPLAGPSPAADTTERFLFTGMRATSLNPVEVELFRPPAGGPVAVGIDIGSTSTKAVLIDGSGAVLVGLYTRTSGRPVTAVQAIFEALESIQRLRDCTYTVETVATTGSGRKFIGAVIGADLVLDEITAHARAACELDPQIDTIIEIGGQDAKFTTLNNGIVTFSHMNTVCAAGTGSFIEEQAAKLGVGLAEIAVAATRASAPQASDRCTVFMERDINNLLAHGYSVDEVIGSVLHSVVQNYLSKVATPALIGSRVCFQGATARNGALVAAFERELQVPIAVSPFCHLAGALGAALTARAESATGATLFRGFALWREDIPVRAEVCELCTNHCKLRVAHVNGEDVAYGFLCGRDYQTNRRVEKPGHAYDACVARTRAYRQAEREQPVVPQTARSLTIGIPAALHVLDDLPVWRRFFLELGMRVVEGSPEAGKLGRRIAKAEFCAPMSDLHGQVDELLRAADLVFVPMYLKNDVRSGGTTEPHYLPRPMCYYTQFAPTVVRLAVKSTDERRIVSPLVGGPGGQKRLKKELFNAIAPHAMVEARAVAVAYDRALAFDEAVRSTLTVSITDICAENPKGVVALVLGRPYTIHSPSINKGIPRMVTDLDVPVYAQDQVRECMDVESSGKNPLPWSYASRIVAGARLAAVTPGLYPILITSFKCSPDSFAQDMVREILDAVGKPYLILQVDDHDSSVGYETRIEAGIRAFRNHLAGEVTGRRLPDAAAKTNPVAEARAVLDRVFGRFRGARKNAGGGAGQLRGKVVLMPNWDSYVSRLITEMMRAMEIDARVLAETPELIARGMRHNGGQCIPVNIIAEEAMATIEREHLDPAKTVLWMPEGEWACNLPMYPAFSKRLFERNGFPEVEVYHGMVSFQDFYALTPLEAYFAYLSGGLLRRLGCMIRPYEHRVGATDAALAAALEVLADTFHGRRSKEEAFAEVAALLDAVERTVVQRPKVAIFGDFYARDNDIFNQGIVKTIETHGGEVVTTPYSEYLKIISKTTFQRWMVNREMADWTAGQALLVIVEALEKRYCRHLGPLYEPLAAASVMNDPATMQRFSIRVEQQGESFENIMKVIHLKRVHPDLALFVQLNPAFCCPALITEAMSERIRNETGVPVVSITYDGTGTPQNHVVVPYLAHAGRATAGPAARAAQWT